MKEDRKQQSATAAGDEDIGGGPKQLDDWEIVPGKPYVARYRFIVADGAPDAAQLNRLWADYATPPTVTVK